MKTDKIIDAIGEIDEELVVSALGSRQGAEAAVQKQAVSDGTPADTKKKKKKWFIIPAALAAVFALFLIIMPGGMGSTNTTNQTMDENTPSAADAATRAEELKRSVFLKEAIEMHPYIAKVKVVSDPVPTVAQQYLQEAVLEENFQNMEESRFTLLVRDKSLKNGSSYVLFMQKQEDVFTGVTSYAYGQKIYTEGDKLFTDTITDIAGLTEEEFIDRLKETTRTVSYTGNEFLLGDYIHATDLPTIVSETACIAVVKVNSVRQTGDDRMMAICTADEVLKGSLTGSFQAIVPLGSVKQGDSVLLLLKRVDGIYVISSQNSLFSVDSEEAAIIRELLN